MQINLYTHIVLTVIALSLMVIAFRGVGLFEGLNAGKAHYPQMWPLNEDGSVSVRLTNLEEIDVNISGISTFDELDVNVVELEGGPVRVELEE